MCCCVVAGPSFCTAAQSVMNLVMKGAGQPISGKANKK